MLLFTGGTGLLCTTLKKYFPTDYFPTRQQLDVTDADEVNNIKVKDLDAIVHCAAITNTVGCENIDYITSSAISTNIIGTALLAEFCLKYNIKLIYISTDYVFNGKSGNYNEESEVQPINKYGWSKLGGECAVQMLKKFIIIRGSFCNDVFKYPKAFSDQMTSRVTCSDFCELVTPIIKSDYNGIIHVGGEPQTVYQLANKLSKNTIGKCSRKDISYSIPENTTLNNSKYKQLTF
jgi:dTDP-4-dehydrorhamnose reductase